MNDNSIESLINLKDIEFKVENSADVKIPVDENKFSAVIINLVKNAVEAFEQDKLSENVLKASKYIKLSTALEDEFAVIKISNNAAKINEPKKIFGEGYSTKEKGSGIGLSVCKKSIEEMYGKIALTHSGDDYTEFVIKIAKV